MRKLLLSLALVLALGAADARANGFASPFNGPRGYAGSEYFAPVYGHGPYGPAYGHTHQPGSTTFLQYRPGIATLGAATGHVAPGHGFQAAPWYLYWPYDAHFLTPAPLMGGYSAPPVGAPYGAPYAPGMPLHGYPGYGAPIVTSP